MKKSVFGIFAFILTAVFAFTACSKEEIKDTVTDKATSASQMLSDAAQDVTDMLSGEDEKTETNEEDETQTTLKNTSSYIGDDKGESTVSQAKTTSDREKSRP